MSKVAKTLVDKIMAEVLGDVVNTAKAEQAIKDLLEAFNIENRPGMEETPARVVKMLEEVWQGELYTNDELALAYNKTFPCQSKGLVTVKNIDCFSYCEHHLALIYDMKISIGYYPRDRVIGLSKLARIADMCSKRLQLQERIGSDIFDVLQQILHSSDIAIRIEANHSCMTARGIKKPGSKTVTFTKGGKFNQPAYFQEFLSAVEH